MRIHHIMAFFTDFKVGYSPERVGQGDKVHTLSNKVKVVSGCDDKSLKEIAKVFELVIEADLHLAPKIKIAEAAKIIKNTQRDVNIALMNELFIISGCLALILLMYLRPLASNGIFLNFYPGWVVGNCIGVDSYCMAYNAQAQKCHPQIINSGRFVNDSMGGYVTKQVVKNMLKNGTEIPEARVINFGVTFEGNVSDVRNSKVFGIIQELADDNVTTEVCDPFANKEEIGIENNMQLSSDPMTSTRDNRFDAAIIAVAHDAYTNFAENDFDKVLQPGAFFMYIQGIYRDKIK